jgi:hypothetical protein
VQNGILAAQEERRRTIDMSDVSLAEGRNAAPAFELLGLAGSWPLNRGEYRMYGAWLMLTEVRNVAVTPKLSVASLTISNCRWGQELTAKKGL